MKTKLLKFAQILYLKVCQINYSVLMKMFGFAGYLASQNRMMT